MSAGARLPATLHQRRSDAISVAIVGAHLSFVLAPVYLTTMLPPGWHVLGLWLWFGLSAHGLLLLMHEAAHHLLFRRKARSTFLGRWIIGPLFVTDFEDYRARHWRHHRRLGTDDDAKDVYLKAIGGWGFVRLTLNVMFLSDAMNRLVKQFLPSGDRFAEARIRGKNRMAQAPAAAIVLFQALLLMSLGLAALMATDGDWVAAAWRTGVAYGFVYLYGAASLMLLMAAIRAIVEHQIDGPDDYIAGRAALRNLKVNPITRLLLGCYGFSDHATHHLEPGIPSYNLHRATRALVLQHPALRPARGYLAIVVEKVRAGHRAGPITRRA